MSALAVDALPPRQRSESLQSAHVVGAGFHANPISWLQRKSEKFAMREFIRDAANGS
jgi:hypothetical protein